jgi:hypothetical protein
MKELWTNLNITFRQQIRHKLIISSNTLNFENSVLNNVDKAILKLIFFFKDNESKIQI